MANNSRRTTSEKERKSSGGSSASRGESEDTGSWESLTAKAYIEKYGVPPEDIYAFQFETQMEVMDKGNKECASCGKHKRGLNLSVCHLKVPIPGSVIYEPKMRMKNFNRVENGVIFCKDCEKQYKASGAKFYKPSKGLGQDK